MNRLHVAFLCFLFCLVLVLAACQPPHTDGECHLFNSDKVVCR